MRGPATPVRPDYTARPGEPILVFRDDRGFAIGVGRITIDPDSMLFVNDVVADLGQLAHSVEGEEVLRQGDAIGRPVRILKADPATEPPNGWAVPDDIAAATAEGVAIAGASGGTGAGCGSTIVYDPANWPRPGDPRSPTSVAVLLLLLRQANLNAAGNSNPSLPDWGDPA